MNYYDEIKNILVDNIIGRKVLVPIKDTVVLSGLRFKEKLIEKTLQKYIDENPIELCDALGEGYTYVKSQYKIKIGNNYNYIAVLLFNTIDLNYVEVELKREYHNKTNGVILCRKDNKWLIKYINSEEIRIRKFVTSDKKFVNV